MLKPGVAARLGKGKLQPSAQALSLDAAQALRDRALCDVPVWCPCVVSLHILCQEETETGQRLHVAALSSPRDLPSLHSEMLQAPTCRSQVTKPIPTCSQPQPSPCHHNGVTPERRHRGTEATGAQQEQQQNQHSNGLFPQNQGRRLKKNQTSQI